jgi:hypothetical protein
VSSEPDAVERRDRAEIARSRHVLTRLALAAIALFVVAYAIAVRTTWGQRLDATALRG